MQKRKRLIVFSGAGMSAESGLKTFRDNNGLWENHDVTQVATPEAWNRNKQLVLRFYNMRRKQLFNAQPNKAHVSIAKLEKDYEVIIITQNVDNLHEKAGSRNVIHLHGELMKVQSERFPELVYTWEKEEIQIGDLCEKGHQLRPNVVWFGEAVPKMNEAIQLTTTADIFIVIGTSLSVYPAAGIVNYVPPTSKCYLIDPKADKMDLPSNWIIIKDKAICGIELLMSELKV